MQTLAELIRIQREKDGKSVPDWRAIVIQVANDIINARWAELSAEITQELKDQIEQSTGDAAEEAVNEIIDDLLIGKLKPEFKGDKGEKGDSIKGEQGAIGLTPRAGIDYPIPKDGKDGKKGKDSVVVGPKGDTGEKGKDGSPDTAEQVRDKLQTLIGEARLDKSAIKGLAEEIAVIMRAIREKTVAQKGGGGMGNVQHESFNVSSATTTVATAYAIGGAGFAIFGAYYNGQQIQRGTHYTVGGNRKTLTLTFTPDDGTVITVVYMRG